MNMKTALIPALVLSALALQACGNGEAKVPEEEKEIPTIPVEVAEVRMGADASPNCSSRKATA